MQQELKRIDATKRRIDRFEADLKCTRRRLDGHLKERLEPEWRGWSHHDVVLWIETFLKKGSGGSDLAQLRRSGLCGKELPQVNDFILRSFGLRDKADRDLLIGHIQRVISSTKVRAKARPQVRAKGKEVEVARAKRCVLCNDEAANYVMIPCGHVAVGTRCVAGVKQSGKCVVCGNPIRNCIQCFQNGV